MLYVQKILPKAIAKRIRLNTDYLDGLQEAIGQWHDATVAIGDWAEDNPAGKRVVQQECLDKLQEVRTLAEGFYQKVHLI